MSVSTTHGHRHIQTLAPGGETIPTTSSSSSTPPFLVPGGGAGANGYEMGFQTMGHDVYDFLTANPWPIMGGLFVLACLYCTRPQVPDERYRGRFGRMAREINRAQKELAKDAKKDKIHDAVTVKTIVDKDPESGDLILGDQKPQQEEDNSDLEAGIEEEEEQAENSNDTTTTTNDDEYDDEEEESECVICLEPFAVGDQVAFSNYSKGCRHVFHLDCIRSWLQEACHDDCPSCRSPLLPKASTASDDSSSSEEETESVTSEEEHESENHNNDEETPTTTTIMSSNDGESGNNSETDSLLQNVDEEAPSIDVNQETSEEPPRGSDDDQQDEELGVTQQPDDDESNGEDAGVTFVILRGQDKVSRVLTSR